MTQIDFHGGSSFRFGDCRPDPDALPRRAGRPEGGHRPAPRRGHHGGIAHLRLLPGEGHALGDAGARPRLATARTFTLATDLDAAATTVPVAGIDRGPVGDHRLLRPQQRDAAGRRGADRLRRCLRPGRRSPSRSAGAAPTARRRPPPPRHEGRPPQGVLRPVRARPRLDPVHGGRRRHGRHLQRLRLRHDLPRRARRLGRARLAPARRVRLALRRAVRLRGRPAAATAGRLRDEHVHAPPLVHPFAVCRLGPPEPELQAVRRPALRRQRGEPPDVPARRAGLVGAEGLERVPDRADVRRRHRVPAGQGAGHRHRLRPHGHRPEDRGGDARPCRGWPS